LAIKFDAKTHTHALKYVGFNSGHTRPDLPPLGRWAVIENGTGKVAVAGLFDDNWQ
jgi:hypothetical protein